MLQTERIRNNFVDVFERPIQPYYAIVVRICDQNETVLQIHGQIRRTNQLSDPRSLPTAVAFHQSSIVVDYTHTIAVRGRVTNKKVVVIQSNGMHQTRDGWLD